MKPMFTAALLAATLSARAATQVIVSPTFSEGEKFIYSIDTKTEIKEIKIPAADKESIDSIPEKIELDSSWNLIIEIDSVDNSGTIARSKMEYINLQSNWNEYNRNSLAATLDIAQQLDIRYYINPAGCAESVLNLTQFRENYVRGIYELMKYEYVEDPESEDYDREEAEALFRDFAELAANEVATTKHIFDEQFGPLNLYSFNGRPLENRKISIDEFLGDKYNLMSGMLGTQVQDADMAVASCGDEIIITITGGASSETGNFAFSGIWKFRNDILQSVEKQITSINESLVISSTVSGHLITP